MSEMMKFVADLTPLNRVPCSTDFDVAIARACEELPFQVIEYPPDRLQNGWVIPPKWDVLNATIEREGHVVWDGKSHALGVIAYSAPFRGRVDLEELKRHLHVDDRFEDAIPFHFRQTYRAWARDWGFCLPKRVHASLEPGTFDVTIETREASGPLKVLEHVHEGTLRATIVIGCNFDHPGVSNDGLAGCAVGIELMRRLQGRRTRFSYALVLVPGIVGSEYYLGRLPVERRERILEGVFLEMLGSATELALQTSRTGASNLDGLLAAALVAAGARHRVGAYQMIILNDEYIWEAYQVPMASLSRFPYPEYHSSRDDTSIMREASLVEAVDVLQRAIDALESTPLVTKLFQGTVCLSNPAYDLYIDPGQVAFGNSADERMRRLRRIMDLVPTLSRPRTLRSIAAEVGLEDSAVEAYLSRWADKGLVRLE